MTLNGIISLLHKSGKFLGEGNFGAVYQYNNLAYKTIKNVPDFDSGEDGYNEFKYLNKL